MGVRTKLAVEAKIMPRALEKQPAADNIAKAVEEELLKGVYAKDAADPKKRQALYFVSRSWSFSPNSPRKHSQRILPKQQAKNWPL